MPERESLPRATAGSVVTVGTFDGMHRGHRLVIERTAAAAQQRGLASIAVTFDPHPLDVVNPSAAPPLLTSWPEKLEMLAQTAIDYVAVVPFTSDLAELSPEEFVGRVLIDRFDMRALLVGHDHGFGRGRAGDVESLRMIGARRGFSVDPIDAVLSADGLPISSTSVRRAVAHGDLARAMEGLGRRYSLAGHVVTGEGRGRRLGFPTLNLQLALRRKLLPPHGVYAVLVNGGSFAGGGMMNIGPRPTFGDEAITLEVHVLDSGGDWYGDFVSVEFVARLRDTTRFASQMDLVAQLEVDSRNARAALTEVLPSAKVKGSVTNTSIVP